MLLVWRQQLRTAWKDAHSQEEIDTHKKDDHTHLSAFEASFT
jgi:hypothetical protein